MPHGRESRRKSHKKLLDQRGLRESKQAIEKLQQLWPAAFPVKTHLVRPLASSTITGIVEKAEWSLAYTRAVLSVWKQRNAYCNAVLRYDFRVDLDGQKTEHLINENAREQARQTLTRNSEARAKRQAAALEQKNASPQSIKPDQETGIGTNTMVA